MTPGENSIHPTAIVGDDVVLGAGNTVGPFAVLTGPLEIGDGNWFGAGVVIGAPPEVRSWPHPPSATERSSGNGIVIGNRNVVREYAQIHQGWHDRTVLGDDCFVMNQVYIAHDCTIGDGVTLASSVLLAGHVRLGDGANLGLGASVHQRRVVGNGAMVGMGSVVVADVPPWAKAFGNPARVRGANAIGMERAGVEPALVERVTELYEGPFSRDDLLALASTEVGVAFSDWDVATR
ncbi:UDP-N-acetylglucosamine acyltransferase [Leifsonia virtsii]|uniref:Acyl-ACP--UDP-N- acetylglucosamine O-acyltransferase n=1 Tax=Leifsonia virtsii TaxID=3035915 RepID=A0ABT8J002_9MICO|nr:UDP-N-acetylglucosamine acyltransferase [Leifsonia virtsii]MDN4598407.1 acyl-ACP--UDP-N- acetylglucosamine O-acyltransferase [Leifsonia virtsii]